MLESVRMRDFSLQYSLDKMSGEERRMAQEINAVIREFRETEHRREGESHFYDALLSSVDSIMFATDEAGRVRWMNKAAIDGLCGFRFDNLDQLQVLHPSLPFQLKDLRKGNTRLVTFSMTDGEERQYAASMTRIFVTGIAYRLYTLQSVAVVLKQGEIQAQQKLIRILTHEIMNSLTPIVSMSELLAENFSQEGLGHMTEEDVRVALDSLSRRAGGLMQFVQRYRNLSGIAAPVIQRVRLCNLMQDLKELITPQIGKRTEVEFEVRCPNVLVEMDRPQMEQVFLNLLKNALETGAGHVQVVASLSADERWLVVSVTDNGGGFSPKVVDNLFTPFFTTKPGGQGIGLAISHQIVSNHGGMVGAECVDGGRGARFTVRLPMRR